MENQVNDIRNLEDRSVVSLVDWIITLIIIAIPVINIIMLCVWAFGNRTAKSKSNWAKANLIFMLIGVILLIIFWGAIAALVLGAAGLENYR